MPQNKKIGEPEGSPSTATQIRWLEVELQAKLNIAMLVRLSGYRGVTPFMAVIVLKRTRRQRCWSQRSCWSG